MSITYKDFHKITFPVYKVPTDNWYSQDGLLFIDNQIVDDKNMPGKTLGIRRLQTYFKDLYRLPKAYDNITALIKSPKASYIDSAGKVFQYEKTKMALVKYHQIESIEYHVNKCVLRVKNIKQAFTIPRPPKDGMLFVGILYIDKLPWILYEYAYHRLQDMRKKV